MSATADQTLEELRDLQNTLDGIMVAVGADARAVVAAYLSSIYGDLENAIFDLECAVESEDE